MLALAIVLSVLMGITLGLLGGGGSILTVPILVYALDVEEKSAIAGSLLVVGITSAFAVISHARNKNVVWKTALIFAGAGMVGSYVGGYLAKYLPAQVLLVMFALIMYGAAFAMWRGRKPAATGTTDLQANSDPEKQDIRDTTSLKALAKINAEGFIVGIVTGLVGAGGGFLVVPALNLLGGLPMPQAVGSSLVVIALKSFAGFAGHINHVTVDYQLLGTMSLSAIVGSFGGSMLSKKIPQDTLRRGFAIFILVMATFLLFKQLAK